MIVKVIKVKKQSVAHKKFYEAVTKRGIPQTETARELGLSAGLMSELMTGKKRVVHLKVAFVLQQAFGIRLQDWFTEN